MVVHQQLNIIEYKEPKLKLPEGGVKQTECSFLN